MLLFYYLIIQLVMSLEHIQKTVSTLKYKWAQYNKALHYTWLERLARDNQIAYWAYL